MAGSNVSLGVWWWRWGVLWWTMARGCGRRPLLRYAMREGMLAVSGLRPDRVGRVLLATILAPHEKGATPDIVLRVGEPPLRHGTALELTLVPRTTECAMLEGHTL